MFRLLNVLQNIFLKKTLVYKNAYVIKNTLFFIFYIIIAAKWNLITLNKQNRIVVIVLYELLTRMQNFEVLYLKMRMGASGYKRI